MSLGHPAYPRSKGTGDQNMPEKRRPAKSASRTLRKTRVARPGLDRSKSNPDRDTGSPIASNQADETRCHRMSLPLGLVTTSPCGEIPGNEPGRRDEWMA